MRRITAICWKSFSPKYARVGRVMAKSLLTICATPLKWPGRIAPSITSATGPRSNTRVSGSGYTSSIEGTKAKSTPHSSSIRQSASSVRGYVRRSSGLLNCVGLTKTLTITISFSERARSTSERWPAWSAPIVGTSPMLLPSCRAASTAVSRLFTLRIISISVLICLLNGNIWLQNYKIIITQPKLFCKSAHLMPRASRAR